MHAHFIHTQYILHNEFNVVISKFGLYSVQVCRIPSRHIILSFAALLIISLSVTIYQIKLNRIPFVTPPYGKERSTKIWKISTRILQTIHESNREFDSRQAYTATLETMYGCSEVSLKDKGSYYLADSCINKKEVNLRRAKQSLVRSVSASSYSRYAKRKGDKGVPLKIYQLAPKVS